MCRAIPEWIGSFATISKNKLPVYLALNCFVYCCKQNATPHIEPTQLRGVLWLADKFHYSTFVLCELRAYLFVLYFLYTLRISFIHKRLWCLLPSTINTSGTMSSMLIFPSTVSDECVLWSVLFLWFFLPLSFFLSLHNINLFSS